MKELRGKALILYGIGNLFASALPPLFASKFAGTNTTVTTLAGLLSVLMGLFSLACFAVGLGSLDEDRAMP